MSVDSDITTQSNYTEIASEHVDFDWTVDFAQSTISGSVTHTLTVRKENVQHVVFDSSALAIESAVVEGKIAQFDLGAPQPVVGSALRVSLPAGLKTDSKVKVTIFYKTSKDSMALQWLAKEQTQGKSFPFLFSQCQPIYARTMAPLQDTSSVKVTYSAKVTSVLPALLSAIRVSPPSDGPTHDGKVIGKDAVTYVYNQPIPIPTYLIAIAVGNLRYRACPRVEGKEWQTGVWAEPETIEAAYWEFEEAINRTLIIAETILPPYKFGVYDVLVLPPSFPYGGMENTCLSFITPTLLVGDRSLVDVVVHELSHSWFGNGVSPTSATHFWLNEGWTTYTERLLMQYLHTPQHRDFSYLVESRSMYDDLKRYKDHPKYQRLVIEFEKGEDPDDAYSRIPYDKGANLLLHLERTIGGLDVFLPYVHDYVSTFLGRSITTEQWKSHLYSYFKQHGGEEKTRLLDSIDWNAWFYGEGIELPVEMDYDHTLAEQAYALAAKWDASRTISDVAQLPFKEEDVDILDTNQKILFLERIQSYAALPSSHVTLMGTLYHFADTPNAELRFRFYEFAFLDPKSSAAKAFAPAAAAWVTGNDGTGIIKGRMKLCRPVFRGINEVDHDLAVKAFKESAINFHPIARRMLERDMGLA
ncbi:uncharacterized protein FIBRA_08753 [Fibroporia radiculosa]|uniref:Peptidase M1 leukotriene A4 hydrolase/aminopeptidase C-terminal domain-containing protein n=1 Tax=Fibroporia radiculosa TaxID=599839 RepID=J4H5C2_9APHY|nr:uncharacterized protein FIBRA_08753 [Fibroporia radiculosa]CCM06484.1 predicted protein [Fibroporia radiculosa]